MWNVELYQKEVAILLLMAFYSWRYYAVTIHVCLNSHICYISGCDAVV